MRAITNDRQSQIQIGRRLDQANAPATIHIHDGRFVVRFVRAVDEVEAKRQWRRGRGLSRSMAASTRARASPAAPKKPSIPARLIASTISTEPMPLAMAPARYGYRNPWSARNDASPNCSGRTAGEIAAIGKASASCRSCPRLAKPSSANAGPFGVRTKVSGRDKS